MKTHSYSIPSLQSFGLIPHTSLFLWKMRTVMLHKLIPRKHQGPTSSPLHPFLFPSPIANADTHILSFATLPLSDKVRVTQFTLQINALCKSGRTDVAWKLFQSAKEKGLSLNVTAFNMLLNGLGGSGSGAFTRINLLLAQVNDMGIFPDLITYNTLIKAWCRRGRVEEAQGLLHKMRLHSQCYPDTITYNTLIHGLCKIRKVDAAFRLVAPMIKDGFLPDIITYSIIINGLCKVGKMDEAHGLFTKMKLADCSPDVFTFNTLINGLCKEGKIDEAFRLVPKMKNTDCFPDIVTYNTLINGLCEVGKVDETFRLVAPMIKCGCSPDIITYNSLIDGLCTAARLDEAYNLFDQMMKIGPFPNEVTFTAIVDELWKAGRIEMARQCLHNMLRCDHLQFINTWSLRNT